MNRLRLGVLLWSAGVLGAVAMIVGVLPQVTAQFTLPAPLWLIAIAGSLQNSLLMALAVWSGVALAPAVELRAPAFEAAATGGSVATALGPQVLPGLITGGLGGLFLFASFRLAPAAIAAVQGRFAPPLFARVLYGGITEEVLLRWGLMTAFAWLAWRFLQRRRGVVKPGFVWLAVAVSALLFAAGHLPAASLLIGSLTFDVVFFVLGVNAILGLLFGWLYWRRGLEAAMIAHAMAHLVSDLVTRSSGLFDAA